MRAEKLKILKEVLGRAYSSGEEVIFHCPFCEHHKRKFSVLTTLLVMAWMSALTKCSALWNRLRYDTSAMPCKLRVEEGG